MSAETLSNPKQAVPRPCKTRTGEKLFSKAYQLPMEPVTAKAGISTAGPKTPTRDRRGLSGWCHLACEATWEFEGVSEELTGLPVLQAASQPPASKVQPVQTPKP